MSLVFYDTETTGLETFFDQILQFAAIQTDDELREIDRFTIRCRLLPHVVPAPTAMLITGVNVSQLTDSGHATHYELGRALHQKFTKWSPTLFLGWNSIDFDEHLVRQTLYKTLHNPYVTSKVGNSRTDAMRLAQACSLFAPSALTIPIDPDEQRMIFKLDQVAPANGFQHGLAHDAMADVEATLHLCRLIMEKAPEVWSSFMRFSKKAAVVDYIKEESIYCLNDFYFGKPHSALVTTIGQSQKNSADYYVFNLSFDPEQLILMSDEDLQKRLTELPKPVRRLKSNAAPIIFSADDAPNICQGRECDLAELEKRAEFLKTNEEARKRLVSLYEARQEEFPKSAHVEKQIYDGFFCRQDEALMELFHNTVWPKRLNIAKSFQDPRLRSIAKHLIFLEHPELLDSADRGQFELAEAARLLGNCPDVCWLTLPQAMREIDELLCKAVDGEAELLRSHRGYLLQCHERASARVGEGWKPPISGSQN